MRHAPKDKLVGSPKRQLSPKQHLNFFLSPGRSIDKIATSSFLSLALLILSSPTVLVCKFILFNWSLKTPAILLNTIFRFARYISHLFCQHRKNRRSAHPPRLSMIETNLNHKRAFFQRTNYEMN